MCDDNTSGAQRNRLADGRSGTSVVQFESKAMNLLMPVRQPCMSPNCRFHPFRSEMSFLKLKQGGCHSGLLDLGDESRLSPILFLVWRTRKPRSGLFFAPMLKAEILLSPTVWLAS